MPGMPRPPTAGARAILCSMDPEHVAHEALVKSLTSPDALAAYKTPLDSYRVGLVPHLFGTLLVGTGTLLYGKKPSYLKFRAIEVIARVPYHSWSSALFTLMTLFYRDERAALELSHDERFARFAADNETMHVVVISKIARAHTRAGFIRYTLVPMLFAFLYFWFSYFLYLINPRWSLELNYLFEDHAFAQYSEFIETYEERLHQEPVTSDFLSWYGREARTEYEFFLSVRNDEIIHRNESIRAVTAHASS